MTAIDWTAPAILLERDDSGSDRDIDFREVARGVLGTIIAQVVAMPPAERARVVIDAGLQGTLAVGDILALSARDDFPGA